MSVRHSNYRRAGKRPGIAADQRQHSLNPVIMLTRPARPSQKKPDESRTGRSAFREDFLLEHSRFEQHADSIELAGCF